MESFEDMSFYLASGMASVDEVFQVEGDKFLRVSDFSGEEQVEKFSRKFKLTMNPDRTEWILAEWRGRRKRKWEPIQRKRVENRQQSPRRVQTRGQKRRLESASSSPASARPEHNAAASGAGPSRLGPRRQQQQPPQQQRSRSTRRQNLGVGEAGARQSKKRGPEGKEEKREKEKEGEVGQEQEEEERQDQEEEGDEQAEEAEQQAHVQEFIQAMPPVDKDALTQQLCHDPRAAQQSFSLLLNDHARVLQQVSRSIAPSASALTMRPAYELDALAETARLLGAPDIKPPSLVIITGLPEAGKSHLGNQLIKNFKPINLVRQDEPGHALLEGPECISIDTSPQLPPNEQGFVYTSEVQLPHLKDVEPEHDWFRDPEDTLLPSGQDMKSITGAPCIVHPVLSKKTLGHAEPCHYIIEVEHLSAAEVSEAMHDAAEALASAANDGDAGAEGALAKASLIAKAYAILGLEESDSLPRPAERKLPMQLRAQKIRFKVNARHPEGLLFAGRIVWRFSCRGYWGVVKAVHIYVPSTKPQPAFMDAPGLAFGEPYRLEKLQEAVRMYPSFAFIVLISGRDQSASEELTSRLKHLGLPGCLGAEGSHLHVPKRAFMLVNAHYSRPYQAKMLMGNKNFHSPEAPYRKILPGLINNSMLNADTKAALMTRTYADPVFVSQQNVEEGVKQEDRAEMQHYLLERFWDQHISPAAQEAQQLFHMVIMSKCIEPRLASLFLALERSCNILLGSRMAQNVNMEVLCKSLGSVTKKLHDKMQCCLPGKTRADKAKGTGMALELRKRMEEHRSLLLQQCSYQAVMERRSNAERQRQSELHSLCKARQLNLVMQRRPSEMRPLGQLAALAVGDLMPQAADTVTTQASAVIQVHLSNLNNSLRQLLQKEGKRVQGELEKAYSSCGPDEARVATMVAQLLNDFALVQLELGFQAVKEELEKEVAFMKASNSESEGWRNNAYDMAMHKDAVHLQQVKKNSKERMAGIAATAHKWGESLIDQLMSYFVSQDSDSADSVWTKLCSMWFDRCSRALTQVDAILEDLKRGQPLESCLSDMPSSRAFRAARLMVAKLMLALDGARKQPGFAQLLCSLGARSTTTTSRVDSAGTGQAAAGPGCSRGSASAAAGAAGAAGASASGAGGASVVDAAAAAAAEAAAGAGAGDPVRCLGRAKQVEDQEEGLDATSAHDIVRQRNAAAAAAATAAAQRGQGSSPHSQRTGGSSQGSIFECCLCKTEGPQHPSRDISHLLRKSPPLQGLAQGSTEMCWPCVSLLTELMTRQGTSWHTAADVEGVWDCVRSIRMGLRRTRRTTAIKRSRPS
ncbi:hypothetical protein DUNSADRAFT_1168 [Dunaliella salina]|uniref:Uncharacterized protein n=1 Tax=Dunaliella salina TaxID=3046 RepID=A0ABQ7GXH1_DUNSA|nr:hypothetical protein DUNSADRAFT_1168 [Dunaliella salina]|eukprot:KAF5839295.1 hypothetical protein DUNSADRAFT_1168 [Dunaliella salina]